MVSTARDSFAKLDSLKNISGATFRIIGLTKTLKIEFLPLDWIYRSIQIITVLLKGPNANSIHGGSMTTTVRFCWNSYLLHFNSRSQYSGV